MQRWLWIITGLNGVLAVALGAFGAHALPRWIATADDVAKRISWWNTASHYHLAHALALGCAAFLASKDPSVSRIAGFCFQGGILLFSGSLYAMALTGARWLGTVTPVGGTLWIIGWAAVALAGYRLVE
jgi:uncharacterized membrane protein YgdD (TMEM256/DUF423 family)